jgi:response regulator RpfG family c-di-GMP phosphodiesterase
MRPRCSPQNIKMRPLEGSDLKKPKAHSTDMSVPGNHAAKTRILVVDEQPLLRYGVATYLNGQPALMVCGEADSISSTQSKIAECRPHLLLIGLRLGTGDSLELVTALKNNTANY